MILLRNINYIAVNARYPISYHDMESNQPRELLENECTPSATGIRRNTNSYDKNLIIFGQSMTNRD